MTRCNMPVAILCPFCGASGSAPDKSRGRTCRCPKCGNRFKVPELLSVPEIRPVSSPPPVRTAVTENPFEFEGQETLEDQSADDATRKPTVVWPWIGGGLAIGLILLVITVGVLLIPSKQSLRQRESARNVDTNQLGIFAQNQQPQYDAASGIAGLLCWGICCGVPVLWGAIALAATFWMAKDAKSRGMDGGMWVLLAWFTGPVGIAIYLFSRPQGRLVQCHNCGNNRMEASVKCPHCGAAGQSQGPRRRREYDE
jgi:hypothetical protein